LAVRREEWGGGEKRVQRSALLKRRRARQGRGEGPRVRRCMEERTGREGRGSRPMGDNVGGVATADISPAAARAGDVAWPRRAVGRTGEGEGGRTGGPWPQCQAVVLADWRAQVAQCRDANSNWIQKYFKRIQICPNFD
jgi:hypothetical protein